MSFRLNEKDKEFLLFLQERSAVFRAILDTPSMTAQMTKVFDENGVQKCSHGCDKPVDMDDDKWPFNLCLDCRDRARKAIGMEEDE